MNIRDLRLMISVPEYIDKEGSHRIELKCEHCFKNLYNKN
jgi:hypothetical protein